MANEKVGFEEQINNNSPPIKKSIITRLKEVGYKPLILVILAMIVAVVMLNTSKTTKSTSIKENRVDASTYTTSLQYINKIESKLNEVIANIKGAGSVKVMISISSSPELSVLENVEEKVVSTQSGTTTTTTTEPIIVNINGKEEPLILKETLPTINGVIVVSSGASDIKVKLDIITAVSTALDINSNKVEVFVGV